MVRQIAAYATVAITFTAIAVAWIHLVMRARFIAALGSQLLAQPRYGAVALFYMIYPLGIVLLAAGERNRARPRLTAASRGALLTTLAALVADSVLCNAPAGETVEG